MDESSTQGSGSRKDPDGAGPNRPQQDLNLAVTFSRDEFQRLGRFCTGADFLKVDSFSEVHDMLPRLLDPEIDLLLVSIIQVPLDTEPAVTPEDRDFNES